MGGAYVSAKSEFVLITWKQLMLGKMSTNL